MLEQIYRTGLLGVAVALVGGVLYAAWGRWFGGERPVVKTGSGERPVIGTEEEERRVNEPGPEDEENVKHILVVGLDGAGKTSVLHSLSTCTMRRSDGPTKMFNCVSVKTEDAEIEFLEIGGSESVRRCWSSHLPGAKAVVYVVDSADPKRMPLAKQELHQLVQGDSTLPVVVLANKQDLKGACTILEVHEKLSLDQLGDERKLFLIGTHVAENGCQIPASIQDAKELIAHLVIS
ncbi:ADP-ribosylation factor-like protein 9 [Hypanus sabinus]|uniref:ADP-ribosylation factor-like protein 9 n=1 Tax=Hypanus sabinus TaxID=79690 RepID=UPI0028C45C72|nr:ADP-ribosylation factor-like protein 9 [Hypanus sabinus]